MEQKSPREILNEQREKEKKPEQLPADRPEKSQLPAPTHPRQVAILQKLDEYLKEFGGESNVPVTHEYWTLLKEYRRLVAEQPQPPARRPHPDQDLPKPELGKPHPEPPIVVPPKPEPKKE